MEITTSTVFLRHARGSLRAPAPSTATKQSCRLRPGVGRNWNKRLLSTARAAVARPQEVVVVAPPPPGREEEVAAPPPPPPPAATETTAAAAAATAVYYHDSWLDKLAIGYLSRNLQEASGLKKKKNGKDGYEGLIEAALTVSAIFGVDEQWETVASALERAVPSYILATVKALMPPSSRFSREYFAAFTTVFFPWLVGPCEVRESEVDGRKERNVVYIPKCRFLESTKCVGMCTNLCKIPCQKFIQDSFGMPVYMSPNFEDMSCEMIFGQEPPQDDPALKQPCFATKCIAKRNHEVNCSA